MKSDAAPSARPPQSQAAVRTGEPVVELLVHTAASILDGPLQWESPGHSVLALLLIACNAVLSCDPAPQHPLWALRRMTSPLVARNLVLCVLALVLIATPPCRKPHHRCSRAALVILLAVLVISTALHTTAQHILYPQNAEPFSEAASTDDRDGTAEALISAIAAYAPRPAQAVTTTFGALIVAAKLRLV